MRKRDERLRALAGALDELGSIRVEDAAARLGCSPMTVRRDLVVAEDRFSLLGGHIVAASSTRSYDMNRHANLRTEAKQAVCEKAIERIRDGDTIFIDCGTTTVHLARSLPPEMRLSVICYSLNIASSLAMQRNIELMMLGGRFNASSASFEVMDVKTTFSRLGISKAFISAAGLHPVRGATCVNFHEVAVKQEAMATALESHLLVDASKIGQVAPAAFASLDRFDSIIVSGELAGTPETERLMPRLTFA